LFADWITSLATENKVGGRVTDPARTPGASTIAEVVEVESPFADDTVTWSDADLIAWTGTVADRGANAILMDFGGSKKSDVWTQMVNQLTMQGILVIAAGGNDPGPGPIYPAWYPGVLAVGALTPDEDITAYSSWDPDVDKPELFAPASLDRVGTPRLAPKGQQGTSYSALMVLAASLLVWSTDRTLTPTAVRQTLLDSARKKDVVRGDQHGKIRILDIGAALRLTRVNLLLVVLQHGPASHQDLLAATGMSRDVALPLLEDLQTEGRLRKVVAGHVERLELAVPAES
jgi:hypothetical protein